MSMRLGVQLYSVRHALAADALGTLKQVAAMGYEGVEFFGKPAYSPEQVRDWLAQTGLELCGWHTPWQSLQPELFDDTVAFARAVQNTRLIVPAMPKELTGSIQSWKALARQMNGIAQKLAGHGLRTGFHNHAVEFTPVDGVLPWDVFFNEAAPEVLMQLDTGNAMSAGADVAGALSAHPGRSDSIHLKPYRHGQADGFATMMGQDSQPYAEIKQLCEQDITKWAIVEYEHETHCEPMAAIAQCIVALKQLGF